MEKRVSNQGLGQPLESGEGEKTFFPGALRRKAICLYLTLARKATLKLQDDKHVSENNVVLNQQS